MANIRFEFESRPTFRDTAGRFARANQGLLEDKRDMARDLGRLFVRYAKDEAPKKTGRFAQGIGFRSFIHGDTVGFTAHMPQPLGNFIVKGTRAHVIAGNPLLVFFWEKTGSTMFLRYVNHPGTKANDFWGRAHERWTPEAAGAIRRISTRWQARVTG